MHPGTKLKIIESTNIPSNQQGNIHIVWHSIQTLQESEVCQEAGDITPPEKTDQSSENNPELTQM